MLTQNKVETIIIGGGLAGILTAYFLSKTGRKCLVVEANKIGSGATSKTTAFLTCFLDTSAKDLINIFGKEKAKLAFQSHQKAIDALEEIVQKESIDCSFKRCSSYYYATSEKHIEYIEEQFKSMGKFNIEVELAGKDFLKFENFGAMEIKNQGKFIASKFIKSISKICKKNGVEILENTEVESINKINNNFELITNQGTFNAENIVIATYYPFGRQKKTHFKKGMYKSYVLELAIPKNYFPEAIYEDTENPYNYFRIDQKDDQHDSMIIGGQDHRMEFKLHEDKKFKALENYAKETFPGLEYKIISKWTGPILEPGDGLALIGKIDKNIYVATAFSGNGMTYSAIAGQLISDLINNKNNPYKNLYNPKRLLNLPSIAIKVRDYLGENLNSIFQYFKN